MSNWRDLFRFSSWRTLREQGVLGMNARNADYILPLNLRSRYPLVDDKRMTKAIAERHGIPVPSTIAILERVGDIRLLSKIVQTTPEFVVKPARGSGGRGIAVVVEHDNVNFLSPGGVRRSYEEMHYHISSILSGLYSLGGHPDAVIIEERLKCHSIFDRIAIGGTPDLRIIVHLGRAVMAMLRLPTRASRGRANLHQGAIGVGIDMASGITQGGVCHNQIMDTHPDTGANVSGVQLPMWKEALSAAERLAAALELGYVGIDIVFDDTRGPVVLEANARPGLAIQIANCKGLLGVLRENEREVKHQVRPT
ncbi:MAG: alpha-L-glutamate ligase-like protein [Planctomycetes bacterium]|nr:alpha-L-glutamate ligase-like protein [Planctomycetota bacterium]